MGPRKEGSGTAVGSDPADRNDDGNSLYRRLYDRFYPPVFRFFRRKGFSEDEALELAQDTFLRVFTHIDGLRSDGAARTWVLTIAATVWKNELRRRQTLGRAGKEISLDAPVGGDDGMAQRKMEARDDNAPDPLEEEIDAEYRRAVGEELQRLPPQMRRCLLLFTFQGLKYKEIAGLMKLSIQTVKSHIHQARQKLKERLERRLARENQ